MQHTSQAEEERQGAGVRGQGSEIGEQETGLKMITQRREGAKDYE